VNGKLVEEKVVSQFASISAGDIDKLMDMYSTFNYCSNMTSIPECVKANQTCLFKYYHYFRGHGCL
jgi:hypothetical protein